MTTGRKVLYFLGAGASLGAGAYAKVQAGGRIAIPTQQTFWETFLRFCTSQKRRKLIESFLFRYFLGYKKVPPRSKPAERRKLLVDVDVEEVFTFLSERARAPSTTPQLRTYSGQVWDALVTETGAVFARFSANAGTRRVFRGLMDSHVKSRDAVVSFNYDTVFEDSLRATDTWAYEGIEDCPHRLPVLKPHGSVNWESGKPIQRRANPSRPVIVAPTHLKFVDTTTGTDSPVLHGYLDQSGQIQDVWAKMEEQMKGAKALVFIGYSFPQADLYFSSVLRSVLADRDGAPGLVLVNPDAVALGMRLEQRFSIRRIVRYFDMNQFVQSNRNNVLTQLD